MNNLSIYLNSKCDEVVYGLNGMIKHFEDLLQKQDMEKIKYFIANLETMFYCFTRMTDVHYRACYDSVSDETLKSVFHELYQGEKNHYKLALLDLKKLGYSHFTNEFYYINSACYEYAYCQLKNLYEHGPAPAFAMHYIRESVLPKMGLSKNKAVVDLFKDLKLNFLLVHMEVDEDHSVEAKNLVEQFCKNADQKIIMQCVDEETKKYLHMLISPYESLRNPSPQLVPELVSSND